MAPIDPKSTINANLHQWAKASTDLLVQVKYSNEDDVLKKRIWADLFQSFVSGARHVMLAMENNIPTGK